MEEIDSRRKEKPFHCSECYQQKLSLKINVNYLVIIFYFQNIRFKQELFKHIKRIINTTHKIQAS